MKIATIKYIVFFVLLLGLSRQSHATITKKHDIVTKTTTIESEQEFIIDNLAGEVSFRKHIINRGDLFITEYYLFFKMKTIKNWWFFTRDGVVINIDDNIYQLLPEKTNSWMPSTQTKCGYALHTSTTIPISNKLISFLQKANRVYFKIYFIDQGDKNWVLSYGVLYEWRAVINTNE